jgi:N-acetylglucosamine-6-phosphate deacetylase
MWIRSTRIYTEDGLQDGWMRIEEGKIIQFGKGEKEGAVDFGDLRIIPGIFDTHIHGTQGYTMWEEGKSGDIDFQLDGFLKGVASEGVTLVFPTLFSATGDGEGALEVLKKTANRVGKPQNGANVAGVHFEGPYLNRVGEKGIRPKTPTINLDFVRKAIEAGSGHLKLMGLAPELPQSEELVDLLTENGVIAAFTHTDCNSAQAFAAFDQGITVATHLCNVMTGIHHRDVGGLGAALLDERVSCELICDGLHVSNPMIEIVMRAKPHEKIMLISDCTGYSGAPTGTYRGFLGHSGEVIVDDLGFVREPGGRLRGSSKPVLYGIWNLVENIGLEMEDALRMASLVPARKYAFGDKKGSLKIGKDADFVVISDDYKALETYVEGRKVFDRASEGDKIFNQQMLRTLLR